MAVFVLHAFVTPGHFISTDGELLYRVAEAIAFQGTTGVLPIEADLRTGMLPPGIPPDHAFATRFNFDTGKYYAQYLPLQPLLSVPLVWLGSLLEPVLATSVATPIPPAMTTLSLRVLSGEEYNGAVFRRAVVLLLFNPLVAALTALVIARMGKYLTGSRAAGVAAAGFWAFGTMAWPHSRTFFTEPLAGLLVLLAFDQFIRWGMRPLGTAHRHALLAGLFLALANLTRVDSPLFTVGLVFAAVAMGLRKYLREDGMAEQPRVPWRDVLIMGLLPLMAWAFLQFFNQLRFGVQDLTSGYGDQAEGVQFATPLFVGLHGLLFSMGKGLFWFSPVLLLGCWGWMRAPRRMRWIAACAVIVWGPFFLAMAKWVNWEGGWCWGPRHIVQVFPVMMLGACFLFVDLNWKRWLAAAVLAPVAVGVQVYGSSQDPLAYYQEYYRTYDDFEYHHSAMTPNQLGFVQQRFALTYRNEAGEPGSEVHPSLFPATMKTSLYIPEHTQWASYRRMWNLGYRDWLLWHLIVGTRQPDRWGEAPDGR